MTSLNKTLREAIINSVILRGTTLPQQKEDLIKRTKIRVKELCLERIPKEFYAAVKNLPKEWFPHHAAQDIRPKTCPISVLNYSEEQMRHAWRVSVSFDDPIKHPMGVRFDRNDLIHQGENKPDDMESWEARIGDLIDEARALRSVEDEARANLSRFLYSVNTYKQIIEKMPELEDHLPNYTKPMPLTVPVTPILNMLNKIGFDQSKEKENDKPTSKPKATATRSRRAK